MVRSAGSVKGSLVKCMDQVVDGFTVQDMLREMLLCEVRSLHVPLGLPRGADGVPPPTGVAPLW